MKIIDTFTFFNELDLLEFRLKLLDPYVDHFVIAESNLTHAGSPKPLFFKEHELRFLPWKKKIRHIVIRQTTEGLEFKSSDHYDPAAASWKLENEQRNALQQARDLGEDDDIFLMGDLDEIPNPSILQELSCLDKPVALSMLFHYYFMNCQNVGNERWWNGTIACPGFEWRLTTPQQLRDKRNEFNRLKKGGWHFSYLGGLEKIREKINSFAHTEFNKEEYTSDENIIRAMNKGEDIFNRPGIRYEFVPIEYYPPALTILMRQYPQFIFPIRATLAQRLAYNIKRLIA
jgi:beta-1,4-mannosyl-glycoprotein beta-1,4-N-acetylglucosaminyltransferase